MSKHPFTLTEVKLPLVEFGPTKPTRMELQTQFEKFLRTGLSVRDALRELEDRFGVTDVQVDSAGKNIVFFK